MSILGRYVFRQVSGAFLLIVLSLSGIVWIALALRELSVVTGKGQGAFVLLQMTTLALPNLMAIIAPFALLIAVIHTLNRLNSDSELIVLTASGATIWQVARPMLLLAALVSLAVAFVNHYGQPASLRQLRALIVELRTDLLTQVIQPGRFSSPEQGLTFHIRDRASNGDLVGVVMHDARKGGETQSYLAERAVVVKRDLDAYVIMSEGHILRRGAQGDASQIIAFDKYAIDLDQFEQKTEEALDLKPRERFYSELVRPEATSSAFISNPGQFRAELHERFANPLYPIVFVLIALAAVGQAQSTRQNRVEKVVAGFLLATGSRFAGLASNNIVVLNAAATPLLYAIPLGAGAIAILMMVRLARPHATISLSDRLADLLAPVVGRVRALAGRSLSWRGRG
ncbi:MAG: LPS export ABC transporter permease LptF [Hyphomicrobium sp.]